MIIYVNDKNFKQEVLKSKGLVIVNFFDTCWCSTCKMTAQLLEELSCELNDVKIVKVNINENCKIVNFYKVQIKPMIKLFKEGKELKTIVGFLPKDQILLLIKRYL